MPEVKKEVRAGENFGCLILNFESIGIMAGVQPAGRGKHSSMGIEHEELSIARNEERLGASRVAALLCLPPDGVYEDSLSLE